MRVTLQRTKNFRTRSVFGNHFQWTKIAHQNAPKRTISRLKFQKNFSHSSSHPPLGAVATLGALWSLKISYFMAFNQSKVRYGRTRYLLKQANGLISRLYYNSDKIFQIHYNISITVTLNFRQQVDWLYNQTQSHAWTYLILI